MRTVDSSPEPSGGLGKRLAGLARKFGVFRIAKFAIATALGFLLAEVILFLGVIVLFPKTSVPSDAYSSALILGLDALAFGIGVTVAFVVNEDITVKGQGEERRRGLANWFVRLFEYQLAKLLGNLLIVLVQLGLLATISLSPVFGSIVGAVVSFPVTYVVSMRLVWRIRPFRR